MLKYPLEWVPNDMNKKNKDPNKIWRKAKEIIPGGNSFFSKRPEQFLGSGWPAYYKSAKGCEILTFDDTKYIDMALMGVGTCTLGYANNDVDKAVIKAIEAGTMSSLNCIEELKLAEKLIEINPWSDMVKFTKSGGEANSLAIRIARISSKNDKVAICGYHGWHDWYLAANLTDNNSLDDHLMSGLYSSGVPKALKGTTFPFKYNDINAITSLVEDEEVGIVKMEVQRNEPPIDNFLIKVRELCDKNNVILIFDECTSGFRSNYGGLHLELDVIPDLVMYGKAIANGYPLCAVVGKKEIMIEANKSFISSTFWSERIGFTAALKTLEIMESIESYKIISEMGKKIKLSWEELAKKHRLDIKTRGIDALAGFNFNSQLDNNYKSFITEKMLENNILASNTIYFSVAHDEEKIHRYLDILDDCFNEISKKFPDESLRDLMKYDDSLQGFQRLN